MPKIKPEIVPYTEKEINQILNLRGWVNSEIDVFNLYGVLTIGICCGPENLGVWEVQQRTYSENKLSITLKDFEGCHQPHEVRERFNQVLKRVVGGLMFKGENWT